MASGFRVNSTNTIVTSNGDIGIGTLTPTSNIHIVSASVTNAALRITASEAINVSGNIWVSGGLTITGNLTMTSGLFVGSNTAWHSGNDGAGSGLDADLLDGANSDFYTNSTNQVLGTLPSGRLTGAYTGITSLGDLLNLNVTGNVAINGSDASNAALRVTQTGAGPVAIFEDSTSPDSTPVIITSSGMLIRGIASTINSEGIQNFGSSASLSKMLLVCSTDTAGAEAGVTILKNRGNTTHQTLIQVNDEIGSIQFKANDGFSQLVTAAIIASSNGGSIAQDSIQTKLIFKTRNHIGAYDERLTLAANGFVGIHNANPRANLDVTGTLIVSGNATVSNVNANIGTFTAVRTNAINGSAPGGIRNILYNPIGLIRQRTDKTTGGAGQIGLFDRWFSLGTSVSGVQYVGLSDVQDGLPSMMRVRNTSTAKQLGMGQVVLSDDSRFLRGKPITLTAKMARGVGGNMRCAILEWTGPKDQVNRGIIADWAQAGGTITSFIDTTNITVLTDNLMTSSAQTVTTYVTSGVVHSNCNNLIVFAWTTTNEAATTGHFDLAAQLTISNTPETYFEFRPALQELELCKKFFERVGGTSANRAFGVGIADTTTLAYFPIEFAEKRTASVNLSVSSNATPNSWSVRAAGANLALNGLDVTDMTSKSATIFISTPGASMTVGQAVMLKANNTLLAYFDFDAEI